ncbi:MAG: prepilin-type N-terminal cleavage/methylation domain-containing protein [Methylacidiphilales bacterium]|nr:prepilin-type N-terminal cleavage/methylation domain-containing protein [Candidatus Methylacidiphilales bacterium]
MKEDILPCHPLPEALTIRSPLTRVISRVGRGFTLIEMLIVIAIIAVLMSLGLPALLNSSRSSGLTDAGNELDNIAMLARQNAVSNNVQTALVLVTNDPYNSAMSGRAVSVWQMGSNQTWTQTSRWMFLPNTTTAYDDPTASNKGFSTPTTFSVTLDGNTLPASDFSAFIFDPEGNMEGPSATTRDVPIVYSSPNTTTPASINTVLALKNYYILVFNSDTGAVYVVRP